MADVVEKVPAPDQDEKVQQENNSPQTKANKKQSRKKKKQEQKQGQEQEQEQGHEQTVEKVTSELESLPDTIDKGQDTDDANSKPDPNASKDDKEVEEESEDEGIEDLGNPEEMDNSGRNTLFERAVQYENGGKKKRALKCYLQCLTGLRDTTGFSFLPQCLRKVADLYFEKEEFEKAIQFIQAEKMFYETALIDTSQLQTKLELAQQGKEIASSSEDSQQEEPDALRADEYEKLARLCLEKQQPKLALDYQGKATKLRQKVYGDSDERTIASLDFFTVVYAQVGKQQYAESLEKVQSEEGKDDEAEPSRSQQESPTSILRKRKVNKAQESNDGEKKQVRFENPPVTSEQTFAVDGRRTEQEEWWAHTILLVLFFLCALSLAAISFSLYCRSGSPRHTSVPCSTARVQYRYLTNLAGFYWHKFSTALWPAGA